MKNAFDFPAGGGWSAALRVDPWFVGWLLAFGALLWLAALPLDLAAQGILSLSVAGVLILLRYLPRLWSLRVAFLFVAAFISLRYLFWRTTETLDFSTLTGGIAGVLLYLAELYGICLFLLGIFVNVRPLDRQPAALPADPASWPTVDVFIPTYNESLELIEVTLAAAIQIDYPRDRFTVHLLDDGGTDQKCADRVPEKAAAAKARRAELQALCARLGVAYGTRAKNEHAKSGNINAAYRRTTGELILILDTDHVPTRDILKETAGWFLRDERLFLVQTPHFFINSDPVERNLGVFGRMPGESEMFYTVIQRGLDFWNAAFFCGSAAVLRRSCIDLVGGFEAESITEDAEIALTLHARGFRSAYLAKPLVAGLAPETMGGLVLQRIRWAQGMAQILLLKNPLLIPGLRLWQRLCYFNSSFFWFFGFARPIFFLAPLFYLLGGVSVYRAGLADVAIYALPHLLGGFLVTNYQYGRVRWTLISELYELILSVFTLPALCKVFLNPRAPDFKVTPKGEKLDDDFVSPLAWPFFLLTGATLIGLGVGLWKLWAHPWERDMMYVNLGWTTFNLLLLLAAIGVIFERKQRRSFPRIEMRLPATFRADDGLDLPAQLVDVSVGGAGIELGCGAAVPGQGTEGTLWVKRESLGPDGSLASETMPFRVRVATVFRGPAGGVRLGLGFAHESAAEAAEKVRLIYGDSDFWLRARNRRTLHTGVRSGILAVARVSLGRCRDLLVFCARALRRRFWKISPSKKANEHAAAPS